MIVKVLAENTVLCDCFEAEHGLSLYIETEKHKLLFDLGQSRAFIKNAKLLKVKISEVDTVILSHAHYDHTGGLGAFLKANSTAKVYINEHAKGDFFNSMDKYIGTDKKFLENDRIVFTGDELQLDDELYIFTGNKLKRPYPSQSNNLKMLEDGKMVLDTYEHEQYLKICENGKTTLITGCSHKGILNILNFAKPYNVTEVIGGFHLKDLPESKSVIKTLYDFSEQLKDGSLNYRTCHCTGVEKYEIMKKTMHNRLNYISTGEVFEI